jgi:hypothetical protein
MARQTPITEVEAEEVHVLGRKSSKIMDAQAGIACVETGGMRDRACKPVPNCAPGHVEANGDLAREEALVPHRDGCVNCLARMHAYRLPLELCG